MMLYLVLSILCSSLIFILFRAFSHFNIPTFPAIVWNYFTAGAFGLMLLGDELNLYLIIQSTWILYSLFLGAVFISLFLLMAKTAQEYGASVAAVANKMSLIIPFLFAIIYYGESIKLLSGIGVVLALVGVFFSASEEKRNKKLAIGLPFILFLGSGFIDTYLQYVENEVLNSSTDLKGFTAFTFITAGILGLLYSLIKPRIFQTNPKSVISGLLLGIINYGSIFFLIQAIKHRISDNSILFPLNNLGIVLITSILSLLLFKEQFKGRKKIGLIISVIALILLTIN